jgi:hypothetical protein
MTTSPTSPGARDVSLEKEEVTELLQILEHVLGETRVEVHHTHTPDYRAQVQKRETLVRGLIAKLKKVGS